MCINSDYKVLKQLSTNALSYQTETQRKANIRQRKSGESKNKTGQKSKN